MALFFFLLFGEYSAAPCHITLFLVSYVRIVNLLSLHAIGSRPYQFMSKQKHYR